MHKSISSMMTICQMSAWGSDTVNTHARNIKWFLSSDDAKPNARNDQTQCIMG